MISQKAAMLGLTIAVVASWNVKVLAQLHPPQQTQAPGPAVKLTTQSTEAEIAGDHARALALADDAIKADPNDPWGHYDRGDALMTSHRTDEAVAAFHEAERRFPDSDTWGRSVAIWGQAKGRFRSFSHSGRRR